MKYLKFAILLLTYGTVFGQSEHSTSYLFKECLENSLVFRVEPKSIQEFVGPDFPLFLDDGKAVVAIIVQDCSQYWVDGVNLGTNQHAHVWVRLEDENEILPVIGAEKTLPTMNWFSLSAASTNPRDYEARKKSLTSPENIKNITLEISGDNRGGKVVYSDELSYSWKVSSEKSDAGLASIIDSASIVGINHIVYLKSDNGKIVIKRIQAISNMAGPYEGILNVSGGTDPSKLILGGDYPILVYSFSPIWVRENLGETPKN